MNSASVMASVSRYTGMVLCAASVGASGVALMLPSAAAAVQASKASKPVARNATNKYVKKAGKPALSRFARTPQKKSRLTAIKSRKQQVAEQTPLRATLVARMAMPGVTMLQVTSTLASAVYQSPDLRTVSLNGEPRTAAPYPDQVQAPRKATTACLVNGEIFLLADCNTEPGVASGIGSHFGAGSETTAVRPADHLPPPSDSDAGPPTANADIPPPEPS